MRYFLSRLLFYRNNAVGTHRSTEGTADALGSVGYFGGRMSFFVDLVFCDDNELLGAGFNTKSAALAKVGFEC